MNSSDGLSGVDQLLEEFLDRHQNGEKPTVEEYCQRHPELANEIRDVFEAMMMVEELKPGSQDESGTLGGTVRVDGQRLDQLGDYRILCEIGRGGMGVVYEAEQLSLQRRVALKVLPRQLAGDSKSLARFQREAKAAARMHHTNIVPVFEVGSDSEHVYYAMQLIQGQSLDLVIDDLTHLRRESVAARSSSSPGASLRKKNRPVPSIAQSLVSGQFQQEQLGGESAPPSSPSLQDENRAALTETIVLQAGSTAYAMLPGNSDISTAESDRRGYFTSVAHIGQQAASALSYAHARGIVHRDIKPSNLLLDAAGVVWVTDFGLAKTGDHDLTHTGDILGTIRYMSPERFRGHCDVRADIYSLGLTLYELLTLKPAFVSADQMSLIERIRNTEATPPRSIDSRIPRDLETIILKAIDKDPKHRYQSADEMEEDLQRFIDDEPIQARRISFLERFTRWSRRNKALAASLSTLALLVLVGFIASTLAAGYFRRLQRETAVERDRAKTASERASEASRVANRERRVALAAKEETERQAELTRRNLYLAHINMARSAARSGDATRLNELLRPFRAHDQAEDLRGFEWYYLRSQDRDEHDVLHGHTSEVRAVAWHPDGRRLASGSRDDRTIRIWDVHTKQLLQTIDGHWAGVWGLDWSPDGTRLASASTDRTVRTWDGENGHERSRMSDHGYWVFDVKWSPDGTRLATTSWDGTVRIWDAESGVQLTVFDHQSELPWSVAWHPEGKRVATGCVSDPVIRVWDSNTGEQLQTLRGHLTRVVSLAWHCDGKRLASGGGDGEVYLWDTDSFVQIRELVGHGADAIYKLQWSPTRTNRLMTTSDDTTARLWDAERGIEIHALKGHSQAVKSGCWSPDGSQFAGGGGDSTVRIWNVVRVDPEENPAADSEVVTTLTWSPDGALMAIAYSDGTIRISQSGTGKLLHTLSDKEGLLEIRDLQFSPDGELLASGGEDGVVRWWNTRTGSLVHRSAEQHGELDEDLRGIFALAWHHDGIRLVSAGADSSIRVWDARTGALQHRLSPHDGPTYCLSFSPDGQRLLSGHEIDQSIKVWDVSTWEQVGKLDSDWIDVRALRFSPDGRRVAVAGGVGANWKNPLDTSRGLIRVWNWPSILLNQDATPEIEISDLPQVVAKLSWSPDNRRLASASYNGPVQLWDVASNSAKGMSRELLRWPLFGRWQRELQFSPDGSRLAVATGGALEILDAFSGYAREKSPQLLPAIEARIQAGTTTVDDYRLRAEVDAAQGNWSAAEKAYDGYFVADTAKPWIVAGTWVAGHFQGDLQTPHAPELLTDATRFDPRTPLPTPSSELFWQSIDSQHEATLDFDDVLGKSDLATAYVYYQVFSLREQEVCIFLGDNDYHRLWVNGQLVSEDEVRGPAIPNEFAIAATLHRGWNSMLAKIVNVEHRHEMFLQLSNQPLELAIAFARTGQYERAIAAWDRILQERPDDRDILLRRAATRWRQGDRESAEADLTAALVGLEDNAEVLEARASLNLQLGRVEQGHADYDFALEVAPDSHGLRRRCISAKLSGDRPNEAAELLRDLTKHSSGDHLSFFQLAIVLLELGDLDGYQEVRSELLAGRHGEKDAMMAGRTAEAALLAPAGAAELAIAAALAAHATQANPHSRRYRNADGLAKYRQGIFAASNGQEKVSRQLLQQARQILESVIEESVDEEILGIGTRYTLAMALHHLGDRESRSALVAAENEFQKFRHYTGKRMANVYMVRILRREASRLIMGSLYEQLIHAEQLIAEGQTDEAVELATRMVTAVPAAIDLVRPLFEPLMPGYLALSPTAETSPVEWTYRLTPPREGWETSTDSEGWRHGEAPFTDHPSAKTRLELHQSNVWLRRTFHAPPTSGPLVLRMWYDDEVRVMLNGTLIATRDGWTGRYVNVDCPPDASALLQPGKNILSVHCINKRGPVAIDVGLYTGTGANPMWMDLLTKAIAANPDALPLVQERGELHVREERFLEAGRDYAASAPISESRNGNALHVAALLALSGNADEYSQYCESLLPELTATESPQQASKLIKSCLLMSDAVDPSQLPIQVVIDQLETGEDQASWQASAHGTVALWAFRNGDFDVAEERLELAEQSARQANSSGTHDVMQLVLPLRAMIDHLRQSKSFGSPQVLLTQTRDLIDAEIRRESDGTLVGASLIGPNGALNHDAMIAELLCREAERTVSMKPQQNSGKSD